MTAFQCERAETRAAKLSRSQLDMFEDVASDDEAADAERAQFRRTEYGAVYALLRELDLPAGLWIEPCAGDGAIIRHVEKARADLGQDRRRSWIAVELRRVPALHRMSITLRDGGDTETYDCNANVYDGQDFTAWTPADPRDLIGASVVITNLPWYGWGRIVSHAFALFPHAHVVGLTCTREAMDGSGTYPHEVAPVEWRCESCEAQGLPRHDVRDRAEWARRHAPDIYRCHGRQSFGASSGYPHPVEWWHWPPGQRNRARGTWGVLEKVL